MLSLIKKDIPVRMCGCELSIQLFREVESGSVYVAQAPLESKSERTDWLSRLLDRIMIW